LSAGLFDDFAGEGEFTMSGLQTVLANLNIAFSRENIGQIAARREAFAPGKPLAAGVVIREGTRLHELWVEYLGRIPASFQEAFRSVVYHALSTEPPTPIVFAWAPGYDYEFTMWYAPDTPPTKGGITILLKSRYPTDEHPAMKSAPSRKSSKRGKSR
jgi:hypothetical protein